MVTHMHMHGHVFWFPNICTCAVVHCPFWHKYLPTTDVYVCTCRSFHKHLSLPCGGLRICNKPFSTCLSVHLIWVCIIFFLITFCLIFDQQILTSVKKVFQDAASCATIQWEDTSVLAWQDTHFWRMAGIVLVHRHAYNYFLWHYRNPYSSLNCRLRI